MVRTAATVDVFHALAEERRRHLLQTLGAQEVGVDELVRRLGAPQPLVSKQLKVLRDAGLVRCRTVGRRRLYRVHAPALAPVQDWLRYFEQVVNERYDRLEAHLALMEEES